MSDEQEIEPKSSKAASITRAWRLGGPMSPVQRKEAKEIFLEWLKKDPTVILACEYASINSSTAYRWREQDSKFADAWELAVERTRDVARSSIYARGILGWDEKVAASNGQVVMEYEPVTNEEGHQQFDEDGKPLMYGGKPFLIHKWSDPLAALYAKANLPEYKEKPQLNVHAQLTDLAEQRKQRILAELEAAIANEDKEPPRQEEKL
jgi:hypothetical protein